MDYGAGVLSGLTFGLFAGGMVWQPPQPRLPMWLHDYLQTNFEHVELDDFDGRIQLSTRHFLLDPRNIAAKRRDVYLHELGHQALHDVVQRGLRDAAREEAQADLIAIVLRGSVRSYEPSYSESDEPWQEQISLHEAAEAVAIGLSLARRAHVPGVNSWKRHKNVSRSK